MSATTMVSPKLRPGERTIGAILVESGRLSAKDVERVLQYQRDTDLRFGEAGVQLGLLTEADVLYALSLQFDYPFLQPGTSRPVSTELVAAYKPFGPEGERLRALRSQLQLRWLDDAGGRTALAIVSANRGEGRSWLAANLAVTFAQLGERTLLIDGDLRWSRQHKLFKIDNQVGLSSLLAGRMQDQVVTFVPGIPGLAVLPSGPTPPNPTELLSRPVLDRVLEQSMSTFDVVILDTPALSTGADAALLARLAGASLSLARINATPLRAFSDVNQMVAEAGSRVVGSVLVDVPMRSGRPAAAEA
jgi:receptor protein-tyrosine kinase